MNNVEERLKELLLRHFKVFDLAKDVIMYVDFVEDLEMDSLTFVSLIVEIEDEFEIVIPDEILDMDKFKNYESILKIISILKRDKQNGQVK